MSQFTRSTEASDLLVRDATGEYRSATGDEVLQAARRVLGRRVRRGTTLTSPQVVRDFLQTKLGDLEHEVFVTLLLDLCEGSTNVESEAPSRVSARPPDAALNINYPRQQQADSNVATIDPTAMRR